MIIYSENRGGTPLYKPYTEVCAAPAGRVFAPFRSENEYRLCLFGLESGMAFEETTGVCQRFYVMIQSGFLDICFVVVLI